MRVRSRVLVVVLLAIALALLAAAVPTLGAVSRQRTGELVLQRSAVLDTVATLARDSVGDGQVGSPLEQYLLGHHALHGEELVVVDTLGVILAGTPGQLSLAPSVDLVPRRVATAPLENQVATVWPWSPATVLVSAPVEFDDDLSAGVVLMEVDQSQARHDVRLAWGLLLGLWVLLTGLGVVAAVRLSRWVVRPLARLEEAVEAVGAGRAVRPGAAGGPPELRRLAAAVDATSARLQTSQRQQTELVASTSHLLRNPLMALRLRLDLMADQGDVPADDLAAVEGELGRLESTVDRLLGLAEVEHRLSQAGGPGSPPEDPGVLDPVALAARWGQHTGRAGVRLVVELCEPLPVVLAEADLEAVLDTLVVNAVKYAGPGSTVVLSAEPRPEGGVRLAVDDDGPGLSEAELEQATGRFWRSPRHHEIPGTGLGLALVAALIERYHGGLTLSRSAMGGLRVTMLLPAIVASGQPRGDVVAAGETS